MNDRPTLVLGRAAEVLPVACRLALAKGRDAVVVCVRDESDEPLELPLPAGRRSREMATTFVHEGIEAKARGSLVVVEASGWQPAVLVERLCQLVGWPVVVALLRPRRPEDDALLDRCSPAFAAGAKGPATALLLEELDRTGTPVSIVEQRAGFADRLAVAGLRFRWASGDSGQASVEVVALMPLLLSVVVAAGQLLAAGVAREMAAHSATAGAAALIQGRAAGKAARDALPGWADRRASVTVTGRKVTVRLRPQGIPGVAASLEAREIADAGPAP